MKLPPHSKSAWSCTQWHPPQLLENGLNVGGEPWEANPQMRGDLEHLGEVGGDGAQLDAVPEVRGEGDAVFTLHGHDGATVVRQDAHGGWKFMIRNVKPEFLIE